MRRLLPVVTIAGLAFMTGCSLGDTPALARDTGVSRSPDICRDQAEERFDSHDLNNDGAPERLSIFRCKAGPEPAYDQLELFYGGSLSGKREMLVMQFDHRVIERLCFDKNRAIYQWHDDGKLQVTELVKGKGTQRVVQRPGPDAGCPGK
jgi:hypothetical protein